MTEDMKAKLLRMRLSIGALGERATPVWWATKFSDPTALSFLAPVMPRSVAAARYHGLVAAARLAHDEHLSAGCFHLFRLPEEAEQDLHQLVLQLEPESWTQWVDSSEQAVDWLRTIAAKSRAAGEGPVLVTGNASELTEAILAVVASVYTRAMSQHTRAYPYLARSA